MTGDRLRRGGWNWRGMMAPSLAVQLFGLLVGAVLAAQAVTLLLTLALPPAPPMHVGLDDVAAALRGERGQALDQAIQAGPPDLGRGRWLVSDRARADLARALRVAPDDVRLGFFVQLPVTGLVGDPAMGRPHLPLDARPIGGPAPRSPAGPLIGLLAAVPVDDQAGAPGGASGGPGGGQPGGMRGFPGGGAADGFPGRRTGGPGGDRGVPGADGRTGMGQGTPDRQTQQREMGDRMTGRRYDDVTRTPGGDASMPAGARAGGPEPGRGAVPWSAGPPWANGLPSAGAGLLDRSVPLVPFVAPAREAARLPVTGGENRAAPAEDVAPAPRRAVVPDVVAPAAVPSSVPSARAEPSRAAASVPAVAESRPVPVSHVASGLFGFAPPPFVEGDFVAAVRLADGRWAVVTPHPAGFLHSWQGRVLLWFALSLLVVAPLAWAFARRLVGPLRDFAAAAEMLGRDPSAAILPLDGPAEIGRAAHAFNQMRSRLRSFVDDRTAMIGAISHDLRTPLTRLRFRMEDLTDAEREAFLGEVVEMEEMISSVISFMRDASLPHRRERLDLAELLDVAMGDAALVGGAVSAGPVQPAPVDVDALGIRRVLDNLLTNAVKYGGGGARVALRVEENQAVADIIDTGPGIPEDEIEHVFEPFYRSLAARQSDREGSGLGLAVCRSIARAHGGDVSLFRSQEGFVARVTLPLAWDAELAMAA